jgi:hypothetical protein
MKGLITQANVKRNISFLENLFISTAQNGKLVEIKKSPKRNESSTHYIGITDERQIFLTQPQLFQQVSNKGKKVLDLMEYLYDNTDVHLPRVEGTERPALKEVRPQFF